MKAIFLALILTPIPAGYAQAQPNSVRMAVRASFDGHAQRIDQNPAHYRLSEKQSKILEKHLKLMEQKSASESCQKKPSSIRCRLSALLRLFGYSNLAAKDSEDRTTSSTVQIQNRKPF